MFSRRLQNATAKFAPTFRNIRRQRLTIPALLVLAVFGFPLAANAASVGSSSAFGESVDLHLLPLLGNTVNVSSGPLPSRSGAAPPAFDLTQQVASVNVSSPLLGTVLQTGILKAHAASTLPGQDRASADAEVNGLALRLAGVLPLLTLSADTIVSAAAINGPCTGTPTASGSATITNAVLGGPAGLGITVPVNPAPNFVLLNLLGIRVVLNEQILSGTGLTRTLTVNAIHVSVTNSVLAGLGVLSGDVVIAQSRASMTCEPPLPSTDADLSMFAFSAPSQVFVGESGEIQFQIDNLGPSAASQVAFTGAIGGPATVLSVMPSQGSCTGTTTLSCSLGSLASGGTATVTVNLRTNAVGLITGTGGTSSANPDPSSSDNQASASIEARSPEGPPPASADLGLTATSSPAVLHVGETATTTLRITNHGPNAASQVSLTGNLAGPTTVLSVAPSQGSCSGTTSMSCALGNLASGGFVSVTVQHRPTATGTVIGSGTVGSATADPTPGNNQASVSSNVLPASGPPPASADLALSATVTPLAVHVNETASTIFRIENLGPNAAATVAFGGSFAGATSILSIASTKGSCSGTTTPSCAIGTLPAGNFVLVTVVHRPTATGAIVASAAVGSGTNDPTSANNQTSITVNVLPAVGPPPASADLVATVVDSPDPVAANGNVTYKVTVRNAGANPSAGVRLAIELPARGTLVSMASNRGSCSGAAPVLCTFGAMTAGQSAMVTTVVRAPGVGSMTFSAEASATTHDPDLANNRASASTQVATAPPLPAAHRCDVDDVPAATLLFPFFEVELDDSNGKTTMISIVNSTAAGRLARVTLWTDCGVPSMAFDVYLTGFDVQTINLRDVLNGKVPQTGLGLSPRGELADPLKAPAGCPSQGTVAAGLNPNQVAHVRAWHTGQRSPLSGTCASLSQAARAEAFGYVTVDAVKRCSTLTPADRGYFGPNGVASNDNVLWGDYAILDGRDGSAKGDTAVHVVAEPGIYKTGNQTFYGRYVNGTGIDNRRPLGTSYASRYMVGDMKTELMVWRDTKVAERTGFACGTGPSWFPMEQRGVIAFDEEENSIELPISDERMPIGLQRVTLGSETMPTPDDFGWVYVDLWHKGGLFGNVAQGWVTTTMEGTGGKYSIGQRTIRLDSACDKF